MVKSAQTHGTERKKDTKLLYSILRFSPFLLPFMFKGFLLDTELYKISSYLLYKLRFLLK